MVIHEVKGLGLLGVLFPLFSKRGGESAQLLYAELGEGVLLETGVHEQAAGDALVQGEALGLVARSSMQQVQWEDLTLARREALRHASPQEEETQPREHGQEVHQQQC